MLRVAVLFGLATLLSVPAVTAHAAAPVTGAETGPGTLALSTPQKQTLKLLQFNISGGVDNGGSYPIIGRVIREVQDRLPDVISLNEICDRQYEHLLLQLDAIGYSMSGYFQRSRNHVPDCVEVPDTRWAAGNAILVRGTVTGHQGYVYTTDHKLEQSEEPTDSGRSVACVTALFAIADQPVKACSAHLSPKDTDAPEPEKYNDTALEARELARVFGPEAASGSFILMGDMNLPPEHPAASAALDTLYAPDGGTTGEFWEVDQYFYCDDEFCDGPLKGGDPTAHDGKIDYTFVSRKHFSFEYQNVETLDAGQCDDHRCSDHKILRSEVYLHQTVTPYGNFRNVHSNKCMTVTGTDRNKAAVQFTCNPTSTDYRWRWEHAWWGEYVLRKENGGRCLRMPSTDNVGAIQVACNANDTLQRWIPRNPTADNLRNVGSSKCLAVNNTVNNSAVLQNTCSTTAAQQRWIYP